MFIYIIKTIPILIGCFLVNYSWMIIIEGLGFINLSETVFIACVVGLTILNIVIIFYQITMVCIHITSLFTLVVSHHGYGDPTHDTLTILDILKQLKGVFNNPFKKTNIATVNSPILRNTIQLLSKQMPTILLIQYYKLYPMSHLSKSQYVRYYNDL